MVDASNFVTTEAPALIGVGVQALVEQADQLGLTWTMRPATIASPTAINGTAVFDGDTAALSVTNLTDLRLPEGARVMGLITPTGNYIVGGLTPRGTVQNYFATVATAGNTASTSFVNMPGSPTVTFTKASVLTNVLVNMTATVFTSNLGNVQIGVSIGGVNYYVAGLTTSTNNAHLTIAGTRLIADIAPGTYAVTAIWAKVSGGGTVTQDGNDTVSFTIQEVW